MDNLILNSYSKISNLNVSRETCNELESFISMIQKKNSEINEMASAKCAVSRRLCVLVDVYWHGTIRIWPEKKGEDVSNC